MTEPQVWVIIAAFVAMIGTMITVVMTSFVRVMHAGFDRIEAKIESLKARMEVRFTQIDSDITALTRRVMGDAA